MVWVVRLPEPCDKIIAIEQDALGGDCLNRDCLPSEALLHA